MAKKKKAAGSAGWGPWPVVLGLVLAGLVGVMVWQLASTPKPGPASPTGQSNPPPETEAFASEGNGHVEPGTPVAYRTDPPTSGAHYGTWARAGFHTEPREPQELVHNLEHGNIVIWYDPERTPEDVRAAIRQLAQQYSGAWDGIVAVPRSDAEHPVILTAWTRMLRLREWDQAKALAFIDAFRGRGPENPVR